MYLEKCSVFFFFFFDFYRLSDSVCPDLMGTTGLGCCIPPCFYRLSDSVCPDLMGTTGLGCCIPPCFLVMLAIDWERTLICWYG